MGRISPSHFRPGADGAAPSTASETGTGRIVGQSRGRYVLDPPHSVVKTDERMPRTERRVAVTGLGMVTPIGNDLASNWRSIQAGRSGVGPITRFDASRLPVRIAGELRDFEPGAFLDKKDIKRTDAFTHYALAAAQMAVDDAGLCLDRCPADRAGVVVGVGMGGMATVEETARHYHETGNDKVGPYFIPRVAANMAPAHIAIRFGLKGVSHAVVTACASGGDAIGAALHLIRFGYQDVMLAGGAEASVTYMCVSGFAAMRALSTRNDEPERASRPFDRDRDGFVIAEGAAVLVLEALDAAAARGARVYGELVGYGCHLRRVPHHRPVPGWRRGGALHAPGARRRRHRAERGRLHQRPRHLDTPQRRERNGGDQVRLRGACASAWPSARQNR